MSWTRFRFYLTGLSDQSRWRAVASKEPVVLSGQAGRDALRAYTRGG